VPAINLGSVWGKEKVRSCEGIIVDDEAPDWEMAALLKVTKLSIYVGGKVSRGMLDPSWC
jgi:hypothetical protein